MAILNSIRKRGIFLIIIIAMALFAFVFTDVLTKGGGGGVENTVATINGTDLERQDFMEQVEAMQRQMGLSGSSSQAMNIIWERELRRVLLMQQYEQLGITAENDKLVATLKQYLADNPTFQDESGQFSEIKMQEYVESVKVNNPGAYQQWLDFVESTRNSILENTYVNMLRGGINSTSVDGEWQYHFENDKVNMEYVFIPYSSIADTDISVSENEIEAYIRANPDDFEVEPQVDIQYIMFDEDPSEADVEDARTQMAALLEDTVEFNGVTNTNDTLPGFRSATDIAAFVNANSDQTYNDKWWYKHELPESIVDSIFDLDAGEIYGPYQVDDTFNMSKVVETRMLPDSVKVRHILIPVGTNRTDNITRTDEEAKATADSILAIIKTNPSKFPEIVTAMSSDAGSIKNEGRYDWFDYNTMVPEFRDFSFEQKTGDKGIVQTQFGYHVIEVEGQKNPQRVIRVATITKEIEPSETTINNVFSEATTFELAVGNGDFLGLAQENGLEVLPVNKIGEMDANIPGIGNNRVIINWAFNEETGVGDVSRFNVSGGYVIAQLTRRNPKGLMSVAEASAVVTPILRNEKKAEQIKAAISGTSLEEIASSQGVTVQNAAAVTMAAPTIAGAGEEPKVVGAAFGKAAGEMTDLIDGNNGVFKVRVLSVDKAPDINDYNRYRNQLRTLVAPGISNAVYNSLKKSADIEDNRSVFY